MPVLYIGRQFLKVNLEFVSMLADCQQNFHLPEQMKEWSPTYTYFSYLVTNCDKV